MNIIIFADLEGATGIDESKYEWIRCNSELWHDYGRKAITEDVKIVVDYCINRGAKNIHICDIHDKGNSVIRETFKYDNILWTTSMLNVKIRHNFYDYAILVGYHPKMQKEGVFPHSFRPDIDEVNINNTNLGEIGVLVGLLSEERIRLILITGDYHAVKEAQNIVPEIRGAIVKTKMNGTVLHLSRDESSHIISKELNTAFNHLQEIPIASISYPLSVSIRLNIEDYIYDLEKRDIKESFEVQGMSLKWTSLSYSDFHKKFIFLLKILIQEAFMLNKKNQKFFNDIKSRYGVINYGKLSAQLKTVALNKDWCFYSEKDRTLFESILKDMSI